MLTEKEEVRRHHALQVGLCWLNISCGRVSNGCGADDVINCVQSSLRVHVDARKS